MKEKLRLGAAGNVVVPAFLALQQRGYTVRCENAADGTQTWFAENATVELTANDPIALLGVAGVAETRGNSWWASDEEIDAFLNKYEGVDPHPPPEL